MTGPEHYVQAEVALADSETAVGEYGDREAALRLVAVAQAHATLALAAATVIDSEAMVREPGNGRPAFAAWLAVTT